MQHVKLVLCLAAAIFIWGCGGGNSTPPGSNPPPGSPPPGSPPPGNAGTQWSSTVEGATGTVTVSTAGDVTVQVTKAAASTAYVGNFCQFPSFEYSNRGLNPCFALPSLNTDATGSGTLTFHFPKSGDWVGAFIFAPGGDTNAPSRIDTNNVGTMVTLSAPLVPVSKMNGGNGPTAPPAGTPQEPGGGSVSLSGGSLTVTLKGATPNASYILGQDFSSGGSASQQVGNSFTTDASGNASVTVQALDSTGQIISVTRTGATQTAGFMSGFIVP